MVRIADLLEPEDAIVEASAEGPASEEDTEINTPQLDEALQILVDLVSQKRVALH